MIHISCVAMVEEIDESVWLKQLEHLCEKGFPQAHFQMGQYLCENGSFSEAFDSFSRGTEVGSKESQYQVGVMLFEGLGTEQNSKRGIELMMKLADTADPATKHLRPNAQFHVGKAFYEGYGVWPNSKKLEFPFSVCIFLFSICLEQLSTGS